MTTTCPCPRPSGMTDEAVWLGVLGCRSAGWALDGTRQWHNRETGDRHFWHVREWCEEEKCKWCNGRGGFDALDVACRECDGRGKIVIRKWVAPCWVTTAEEAEKWQTHHAPCIEVKT